MKRPPPVSWLFRALLLCAIFFLPAAGLAAQESEAKSRSMVFLPFSIHAAPELSYLGEGIRNILASRLAAEAGVAVVNSAQVDGLLQGRKITPALIQEISRELEADYLVMGGFTALAGSIRLDATVYEADSPELPVRVHAGADSEAEVLRAVDQLAWEIGSRIFGIRKPGSPAGAGSAERVERQEPRPSPFRTAHPEKAFLGPEGEARRLQAGLLDGEIGSWGQVAAGGFSKSSNFDFIMQALETGDLTGDGKNEFVLASRNKIFLYRVVGGRLEEIDTFSIPSPYRVHWLSLADLDGDGAQELYISAASATEPRSLALVWDGERLQPLFEGAAWYIRAMELPGEGMVLLGQQHAKSTVLRPGIQQLRYGDGSVLEAQPMDLPDWLNIFDFAMADVTGDGQPEIIHINQQDYLLLSRSDGTILWRSGETYGGSKRILGGDGGGEVKDNLYQPGYVEPVRYYVPARLLTVDLNGNGSVEVLVNRNHAKSVLLLGSLRSYGSGEINALAWNGRALAPVWQSRKLDGYIVDYLVQPNEEGLLLQVGVELDRAGLLGNVASSRESTIFTMSPQ